LTGIASKPTPSTVSTALGVGIFALMIAAGTPSGGLTYGDPPRPYVVSAPAIVTDPCSLLFIIKTPKWVQSSHRSHRIARIVENRSGRTISSAQIIIPINDKQQNQIGSGRDTVNN
jgi:hypothetical protein